MIACRPPSNVAHHESTISVQQRAVKHLIQLELKMIILQLRNNLKPLCVAVFHCVQQIQHVCVCVCIQVSPR